MNVRHFFEVRNRTLSHENVAKGAIRGCGSPFYFFGKKKSRVVELVAVAVKLLHFSGKKACAKSGKNCARLFFERSLVPRGGCKLHSRQRDRLLQMLFTDESKGLIAVFSRK